MLQGQLLSWILNPWLKLYHRQNNNNHISENRILIKKKRKETVVVRGHVHVQIILIVSFGEVPESMCTKFLTPYKYVGYTPDQCVDDHWFSAAGNYLKNNHGIETIGYLTTNSFILKRCKRKLVRLFTLWHALHKEEEALLKQTLRLNLHKPFCLLDKFIKLNRLLFAMFKWSYLNFIILKCVNLIRINHTILFLM